MTQGIPLVNENFSASRAGDFAEYYAVTWLWDNGWDVFKNCGCDGMIDLIAVGKESSAEPGKILFIDVKTSGLPNRRYGTKLTPKQKELGVCILQFNPNTRECKFQEHKHEEIDLRRRNEQQAQCDLASSDSGC